MRLKLKPKDPAAVMRDPHTKRALKPAGSWVKDSHFWQRRIAAKEVEVIETREVVPLGEADEAPAAPAPADQPRADHATHAKRGRQPLPGDDR